MKKKKDISNYFLRLVKISTCVKSLTVYLQYSCYSSLCFWGVWHWSVSPFWLILKTVLPLMSNEDTFNVILNVFKVIWAYSHKQKLPAAWLGGDSPAAPLLFLLGVPLRPPEQRVSSRGLSGLSHPAWRWRRRLTLPHLLCAVFFVNIS